MNVRLTAVLSVVASAGCGKADSGRSADPTSLHEEQRPFVPRDAQEVSVPKCTKVIPVRAWRFRGYTTIEPAPGAELVAFQIQHAERLGFRYSILDDNGLTLDTQPQLVDVTADGAPVDRFDVRLEAFDGPVDLVMVAALHKDARMVGFAVLDDRYQPECGWRMPIEEAGPIWPQRPELEILRIGRAPTGTLLVLLRAERFLAGEWFPPQIFRTEHGVSTIEHRRDATRFVDTDARGNPVRRRATTADQRYVVAEYSWLHNKSPIEYATWTDPNRKLPSETPWIMTRELRAALDGPDAVLRGLSGEPVSAGSSVRKSREGNGFSHGK